jgi:cell division septation protein DedD
MKHFLLIVLILAAAIIVVAGCSDDKKEEAARLEQEMMQDTATPPPAPDTTAATADTARARQRVEATAVPQEESPQRDMPARPAGSGYAIQIAGCEDPAYAEHLVDVYQRRGYQPYVSTFTKDGQLYYRVRLGLFESLAEARKVQTELNDRFSIYPWIDVVEQ